MPLRHRAQLLFCLLLLIDLAAKAQSVQPVKPMAKDAHPSFEVATVKPHVSSCAPCDDTQGFSAEENRVRIRNETLAALIYFAFSIHRTQIAGLPSWAKGRWDVVGTTDTPGEPSVRQQQEMLQKLLADRFGLKFHHEKRELPVYAIQIAKGGPKLKAAAEPDEESGQNFSGHGTEADLEYTSTDMADFIIGESFVVDDRPLIDQTGLTSKYDFSLHYRFKESTAADNDPKALPGLFTAVQEQLGLKFVPTKAFVDVLVIAQIKLPLSD